MLAEMQMRISHGPHAALSIAESASAEDVRAAFLQLTKQFHPARFGRMSGEVHRLANEVFLGIKEAHDQLTKALGSSGRIAAIRPSSSGVFVPPSPGTQRGTGVMPRAASPQPPAQLARGTDRGAQRASTPNISRAASPVVPPPGRAGSRQPSSPSRAGTPPFTGARPASPSLQTPPQRTTPAGGVPIARPTGRMPRIGTPPQQRPSTPPQRPATPPQDAFTPPTIRYSGVRPTQSPPSRAGGAFDEERELAAAMQLIAEQQWPAARQALHALAAKMPQSRHYRALLCYARGRETQAAGRADDAALEFQRALQLDSDLEIAKQALRELGRKSRF